MPRSLALKNQQQPPGRSGNWPTKVHQHTHRRVFVLTATRFHCSHIKEIAPFQEPKKPTEGALRKRFRPLKTRNGSPSQNFPVEKSSDFFFLGHQGHLFWTISFGWTSLVCCICCPLFSPHPPQSPPKSKITGMIETDQKCCWPLHLIENSSVYRPSSYVLAGNSLVPARSRWLSRYDHRWEPTTKAITKRKLQKKSHGAIDQ